MKLMRMFILFTSIATVVLPSVAARGAETSQITQFAPATTEKNLTLPTTANEPEDEPSLKLVAHLDIPADGVAIKDQYTYVASEGALIVLDMSNPASPEMVGKVEGDFGDFASLVISQNWLFGTNSLLGPIVIFDITDPRHPVLTGSYIVTHGSSDVTVRGDTLYVLTWNVFHFYGSLGIINISNLAHLDYRNELGWERLHGWPQHMVLYDEYAFVTYDPSAKLEVGIVHIADSNHPQLIGRFATPGEGESVAIASHYAYIADGTAGLTVADIASPSNPRIVGQCVTSGYIRDVAIAGQRAFGVGDGVYVINIEDATAPVEVASFLEIELARDVAVANEYVYVAGGNDGLFALRYNEKGYVAKDQWIAYVTPTHNEVALIKPDGSQQQVLCHTPAQTARGTLFYSLAWSPDGRCIFVHWTTSTDAAEYAQFICLDGKPALSYRVDWVGAAWLPDSSGVLYGARNGDVGVLTPATGDTAVRGHLQYADEEYKLSAFFPSPDAMRAVFGFAKTMPEEGMYIPHRSGMLLTTDMNTYVELASTVGNLSWAPDSIHFAVDTPESPCPFYGPLRIFDTNTRTYTDFNIGDIAGDGYPVWSPSRDRIAFSSWNTPECDPRLVWISDPDGANRRQVSLISGYPTSWSPDGKQVLFFSPPIVGSGLGIHIIDLENDKEIFLTNGYSPQWQPDPTIQSNQAAISGLVEAKRELMPQLQSTTYIRNNTASTLTAYDEDSTKALLAFFEKQSSEEITADQVEALRRFVLQEQALAATLADYSRLNNDLTDIVIDLTGLGVGTLIGILKAGINLDNPIYRMAEKAVRDSLALFADSIADDEMRELIRSTIDAVWDLYSSSQGDPEAFLELMYEDQLGTTVAQKHISALVDTVQPSIEAGSASVRGDNGKSWSVDGRYESAVIQIENITTTSKLEADKAHELYLDLQRGRDLNELQKDLADILSVSTGKVSIWKVFSLWTRFQQVVIDWVANDFLTNSMICIRDLSARAGELAFQPSQQMAVCASFYKSDEAHIQGVTDQTAWAEVKPVILDSAAILNAIALSFSEALQSDDQALMEKTLEQLTGMEAQLVNALHTGQGLIIPRNGQSWSRNAHQLSMDMITLQMEAVALHLALRASLVERASESSYQLVIDHAMRINEVAGNMENHLKSIEDFENMPMMVPVFTKLPASLQVEKGQNLEFALAIHNVGNQAIKQGLLTVSAGGQILTTLPITGLNAGEVRDIQISAVYDLEQDITLQLHFDGNGASAVSFVPLFIVQTKLADTPGMLDEKDTDNEFSFINFLQDIWFVIVLSVVGVAVFVLGLVSYIITRRHV